MQITTINGAKVLEDKQDIVIPQGIAHGVDRVMFPLPVGDLIQTLQSDRERRFTSFLRALFASKLAETFQGKRIYIITATKMFMQSVNLVNKHLTWSELTLE